MLQQLMLQLQLISANKCSKSIPAFSSRARLSHKMASAPQLPKANVQPPYPMVSSPADAIENHGASGDDDIQHCLHPRTEEEGAGKISKRTRWTVLPLEGESKLL